MKLTQKTDKAIKLEQLSFQTESNSDTDLKIRLKMVVAYNGLGFHGFAFQPDQRTVAGSILSVLKNFSSTKVDLVVAGRTDSGVHAKGQVIHCDLVPKDSTFSTDQYLNKIQNSCNKMLGPEIVVRDITIVEPSFHARHSAVFRRYIYQILNCKVPDPFLAPTTWHIQHLLDVSSMRLASDPLIGEHDFSSFCKKQSNPTASYVRKVLDVNWSIKDKNIIQFEIKSTSFCQQMVRSIVGLMVEVGMGKLKAGDVTSILRSKDRSTFSTIAPPQGLFLMEVGY